MTDRAVGCYVNGVKVLVDPGDREVFAFQPMVVLSSRVPPRS